MAEPLFSGDPDTDNLLQIVAWNLTRFFGYEQPAAEQLVSSCYTSFPSRWDDDFYHHQGAFRSGALMHYHATHGGSIDFTEYLNWYRSQPFDEPEREAREYFRQTYFERK